MTKTVKISIGILLSLAMVVAVTAVGWLYSSQAISLATPVELTIEEGSGVTAIAQELQASGLIKSARAFKLYASFADRGKKFKAGHYIFDNKVTFENIAKALTEGDKTSNVIKATMPEGWTNQEIDNYFVKNNMFAKDEFKRTADDPVLAGQLKGKYAFLADQPSGLGLEGFLFPDTYSFFKTATVSEVIEKMLVNFDRKLKPEWRQEIARQGKTIHQVVTMASIIEKEVRKQEDMKMVSDIFWRRIRSGQGLESCATLAYILGVNKPQYSLEDTQIDSPYNTYRNNGLPPGPISNPGASAIEAAIYPQANKFNFFLTASGSGETVYSVTFDEHVRNKNKYLK